MNGMDSQKRDAIARKAWCQAIVKLPSAYATSRDIAKLLNVCKTKAIQILKAAGGVKIAGVWRVDKADLILYLASMEKATMCSKTIAEALVDALPVDGTRGCAAHAVGACRATERTVDRGDTATNSSEEDRMDVTNNMNVDPSSISRRSLVLRSTSNWWVNTTFKLDI